MEFIKTHLVHLGIFLILLAEGFICIYALNHNSFASAASTVIESPQPGARQINGPGRPGPGGRPDDSHAGRQQMPPGRPGGQGNNNAGTQFTPYLIAYSLGFIALSLAAYFSYIRKKLKINPGREKVILLFVLCLGLLVRVLAARYINGHPFDMSLFQNWARAASDNLFQLYSNTRADYPPLYMYVLYIIGKIAGISAMNPYYSLLLKLPSLLADMASAYLIYRLARKYLDSKISLLLCAFYLFNPAVLINSAVWGQVDSFFTFIIICALWMLAENKIGLSSALFTAAVLMKPQGIIFLPVLGFELIRRKNWRNFAAAALGFAGTALLIILPFALHEGWPWIFKLYAGTLAEYPYASVNAFNFFSLLGANYVNDGSRLFLFSYHNWGMIFIFLLTAWAWFVHIKGNRPEFAWGSALLLIAGVFTFSSRIHERYLFPAVALSILAFIYLRDKRLLLLAAGFSATSYINTHFVFFATVNGTNQLAHNPVLICTALVNIGLVAWLIKVLYDMAVKKRTLPICPDL